MSAKLIANSHVQIYKYTEYASDQTKVLNTIIAKYNYNTFIHTHKLDKVT